MTSPRRPRLRLLTALTAAAVVITGLTLVSPAHAVTKTPFIVVGTSDVSDSNLMAAVIEPGFEAAYPQYDLQYVAKGTGPAITYAEAGSASALIVHAESLENQFVDPSTPANPNAKSFSYEQYGRAIFYGDFVLLGPPSDPAHVMTDGSHNIVQAFQDIAAAGAAGHATFVSRGGTPGTTIAEHAIWALTDSSVNKCDVSQANGLGQTPTTDPPGPCASPVPLPSWYQSTGLSQALNVKAANACTGTGFVANSCYVFTDRGTYDYLASQGSVPNLQIVTRDNAASAPGGDTLLINTFHAYAVNPAAVPPGSVIDTAAATRFLDWLTSPAAQLAVKNFLSAGDDPPFIPSAAPRVTVSSQTVSVLPGRTATVRGHLANVVPGTPVLAGEPVNLTIGDTLVAGTTTDSSGNFTLTYKPTSSASYAISVPAIAKVENATLSPAFGDLLAATSVPIGRIAVQGTISLTSVKKAGPRAIRVRGKISPNVTSYGALLRLYAGRPGKPMRLVSTIVLPTGASTFNKRFVLGTGTWRFQLSYSHPGVITTAYTPHVRRVTLP